MRIRGLVVLWLLFSASAAIATAQAPDRIVYEGQTYALHTNPLGQYFARHPERHPREAQDGERVVMSTGLWRGYVATFAIEDDSMVLLDFEVLRPSDDPDEMSTRLVSEIERFFETPESRILDWYSGIMVIPQGEMIHYVHLAYASVYESYLLLRIEDGSLIDSVTFSADEFIGFKQRQFTVFRESDEYQEMVEYYSQDEDYDQDFLNQFIFDGGGFVESVMIDFHETTSTD